jgi:hypothetical protein
LNNNYVVRLLFAGKDVEAFAKISNQFSVTMVYLFQPLLHNIYMHGTRVVRQDKKILCN